MKPNNIELLQNQNKYGPKFGGKEYYDRANKISGRAENVYPEFALMTAGVGGGILGGVEGAALHGTTQGAIWNASNIAGEQTIKGLITDIIGGGIGGGILKGVSKIKPSLRQGISVKNKASQPLRNAINNIGYVLNPEKTLNRGQKLADEAGVYFNELQNSPEFKKRFFEYTGSNHYKSANQAMSNVPNDVNAYSFKFARSKALSKNTIKDEEVFNGAANRVAGYFDPNTDEVFVRGSDVLGIPYPKSMIKGNTVHELMHRYADKNYGGYATTYSPKTKYYTANDGWKHKEMFDSFANKTRWTQSPEEHIAELNANRYIKKIPINKNYTEKEAIDFINKYENLYNKDVMKDGVSRTNAIKFITKFGGVAAPISVAIDKK